MNSQDLSVFRKLIAQRIAELDEGSDAGRNARSVVELDQQAVGRLSRMDALQNQAMAKAQQTRRDIEKRRLHLALRRMDEGEYGYCDTCGEDLPQGRLRIDPAATLCVSCSRG